MTTVQTKQASILLKDISKSFGNKDIFRKLNLEVQSGSFVTLAGRSGCGKSTLLRVIAGLENISAGEMTVSPSVKKSMSYVFQEAQLLPWKTAWENVALPFEVGHSKNVVSTEEKNIKVLTALKKVQLEDHAQAFPHELSGGMKMRVSLARALVNSPKLLLMDEPFAALDETTRYEMQEQLLDLWKKEDLTVIFVTHSLQEAAILSERVILIKGPDAHRWDDITLNPLPGALTDIRTSLELNLMIKDLSARMQR